MIGNPLYSGLAGYRQREAAWKTEGSLYRPFAFSVGFSCITCATGLEVMLRQQKGVVSANASYPDARVVIGFDENLVAEDKLKEFIVSCGFTVA